MEWQHIPACRIVWGPDPRANNRHADCNRNAYANKYADNDTYPHADANPDNNTYPNTDSHLDAHSHWRGTETTGLLAGNSKIAHRQRIGGKLPGPLPGRLHGIACFTGTGAFLDLPGVDDRPREWPTELLWQT